MKKNINTYFVTNPEFGFENAGVTVSAIHYPSPAGSALKPIYMLEITINPGRAVKQDEFIAAFERVFASTPGAGEVGMWMDAVSDNPAEDDFVVNIGFEPDGFSFEQLEAQASRLVAELGFGTW